MTENRHSKQLESFIAYCRAHPTDRFWQALRNWSGINFIFAKKLQEEEGRDTFYWEVKNELPPDIEGA